MKQTYSPSEAFQSKNAGLADGRIFLHFSTGAMFIMLSNSGSNSLIGCVDRKDQQNIKIFHNSQSARTKMLKDKW